MQYVSEIAKHAIHGPVEENIFNMKLMNKYMHQNKRIMFIS